MAETNTTQSLLDALKQAEIGSITDAINLADRLGLVYGFDDRFAELGACVYCTYPTGAHSCNSVMQNIDEAGGEEPAIILAISRAAAAISAANAAQVSTSIRENLTLVDDGRISGLASDIEDALNAEIDRLRAALMHEKIESATLRHGLRLADKRLLEYEALSQPIAKDEPSQDDAEWMWVPAIPTLDMKRAGVRASELEYLNHAADVYTEMIANAPLYTRPQPQELPVLDGDQQYQVIVDRRDLYDFLRAAWREGHADQDNISESEMWSKESSHANNCIEGWTTMRAALPQELPVLSDADKQKLDNERNANRELRDAVWGVMQRPSFNGAGSAYLRLESAYLKAVKASAAISSKP